MTNAFHGLFWFLVFSFWIGISGNNHPTLELRFFSTLILVGCSALYYTRCIPEGRSLDAIARSLVMLLGLGGLAAVAIMGIYELRVGPDPRRFGFVQNFAMDTAFIGVHAILAALIQRVARARAARRS